MSFIIRSYTLNHQDGITEITLPKEAEILHIQVENSCPKIWLLINIDEKQMEKRIFKIIKTGYGYKMDTHPGKYIATFKASISAFDNQRFYHVFE